MSELKPCPFCGGTNTYPRGIGFGCMSCKDIPDDPCKIGFMKWYKNKYQHLPSLDAVHDFQVGDTRKMYEPFEHAWNTRHEAAKASGQPDELSEMNAQKWLDIMDDAKKWREHERESVDHCAAMGLSGTRKKTLINILVYFHERYESQPAAHWRKKIHAMQDVLDYLGLRKTNEIEDQEGA